jgi:subtilisin family serine protease
VINRTAGTAYPRLKFIFLQGTRNVTAFSPASPGGPDIVGPSLFGHSASIHGISVAAVPWMDSSNSEPYSSYGPAVLYFGPVLDNTPAPGIPPQSINQPDIAASDGGCTTFFGVYFTSPLPGCFRFYGTSAAAPHAAGAAALLKQRANLLNIPLTNQMVKSILRTTAQVVSAPNPASAGSGLVDVLAATAKLGSLDPLYLPVIHK